MRLGFDMFIVGHKKMKIVRYFFSVFMKFHKDPLSLNERPREVRNTSPSCYKFLFVVVVVFPGSLG